MTSYKLKAYPLFYLTKLSVGVDIQHKNKSNQQICKLMLKVEWYKVFMLNGLKYQDIIAKYSGIKYTHKQQCI